MQRTARGAGDWEPLTPGAQFRMSENVAVCEDFRAILTVVEVDDIGVSGEVGLRRGR
jgi:hypothetical protein